MSLIETRSASAASGGDLHKLIMDDRSAGDLINLSRMVWGFPMHLGITNLASDVLGGIKHDGMKLIRYDPSKVAVTGPDLNKRISTTWSEGGVGFMVARRSSIPDFGVDNFAALKGVDETDDDLDKRLIFGPSDEYLLWPIDQQSAASDQLLKAFPTYLVPIPENIEPTSIVGKDRTLLEGIDFFAGIGVLLFRQDPSIVLPDPGCLVCRSSTSSFSNSMNFIWGVDRTSSVQSIAAVMRGGTSVTDLERACREEAGMKFIREDSVLQEIIPFRGGTVYRFDKSIVWIGYQHTPLVVGGQYSSGYCIGGDMLRIFGPTGRPGWHRDPDINWGPGMDLGRNLMIPGLRVPDYPVSVTYSSSTGSLDHVRLWLEGTDEARATYWSHCQAAEIATGYTLAVALNMNASSQPMSVNAIDLFFQHGTLNESGIIAQLKLSRMPRGARYRVADLLQREKPTGSTLVILDR